MYDTDEVLLAEAYLIEGKSSNWVQRQGISSESFDWAERRMLSKGYYKHKCTGVWKKLIDISSLDYGFYEYIPFDLKLGRRFY
jgi:hypothetical protein